MLQIHIQNLVLWRLLNTVQRHPNFCKVFGLFEGGIQIAFPTELNYRIPKSIHGFHGRRHFVEDTTKELP